MSCTDLGFRRYQADEMEYYPDERTIEMAKQVLLAGHGYYDVTTLPYGGSFHRASEDTPVEIIEGKKGQHPDEVQAKVGERTIVVRRSALRDPDYEACDECSGTRYPEEQHEEHCSLYEEPMKCRSCGYYPCTCGADERS